MEAEIYPEPRVSTFIVHNFIPVRLHIKKHPEAMERFGVNWTPTILIVDSDRKEQHRIEGFLPADEFLGQLQLGLGHALFARQKFAEAEQQFRDVSENLTETDAAAEAMYWAGVSRYKATNDASALKATAQAFKDRYQNSIWAKKASIWS
ncbi:MAG TPA: thioredoxin fold domain-containing protein [Thermoanaerobaculia bacterium]